MLIFIVSWHLDKWRQSAWHNHELKLSRQRTHNLQATMALRCAEWQKIPVSLPELSLPTVLRCGQSFRWKNFGDEWSCALYGRIIHLKQDSTNLHYRAIYPPSHKILESDNTADILKDYFNLSVNLTQLYKSWSERDPIFKKKAPSFIGVRILRQDPWENLVSFICSTNNNISRISQMVEKLCINYGPKLGEVDGTAYYDFPPPEKLAASGVEQKLRELGFGYRAKYIANTARIIAKEKPSEWLPGLRKVPYKEAYEALLSLSGVGPKVADCVCLMSMDKAEAVPVDTHVWQIAVRDYQFGKGKLKSLTPTIYWAVGDFFRELWGPEAGWAHSVLFTADLRAFSERSEMKTKKINVKKEITKDDGIKQEVTEGELVSTRRKRSAEQFQGNTNKVRVKTKEKTVTVSAVVTRRSQRLNK